MYIPPGSKVDCYTTLFDFLISNNLFYDSDVIFLGDFNMPDYILWSQSKSSSSIYTHCSCFCIFFTLNQFNNVANNMEKLLDLVLSNGSCCVTKANDILLREDKYHPALHIVICAEFWENFPTSACLMLIGRFLTVSLIQMKVLTYCIKHYSRFSTSLFPRNVNHLVHILRGLRGKSLV
jgi:hypothetical protein